MKIFRFICLLLVIVGAINWGLWGFFQYDLVADIFGGNSTGWARLIYALVGLAGLYGIRLLFVPGVYNHTCHSENCKCDSKEDK